MGASEQLHPQSMVYQHDVEVALHSATSHQINVSEGYDVKVQLILIWITNNDMEIRGKEISYDIIPYKSIWYRTAFCFKCRGVA